MRKQSPGIGRRVGAAFASFAVVATSLVAAGLGATAAHAAPNPSIVVNEVSISSSDGGQATVGDTLTIAGSWDASAANPQDGDTFTIGLPPELRFTTPVPFALTGANPLNEMVAWANCLTDPASGIATCTLTDQVVPYPELVKGTFEFDVEAALDTTAKDVVFDLNGEETPISLPGGGGIDDGIVISDEWDKAGALNSNKWSVTWTINLPGSRMAGEDSVTILEQLSDNHVLCDPSNLKVETVRGSTVINVTEIATAAAGPTPYDFSILLAAPENGFDRDVTYRVKYETCTPDGQIDPQGTIYENEATIDVFGESSGIIGVGQDWAFTGQINKQGSVLGGADRNGKIGWTVTVAGDHLKGKDNFTLTEALTGQHEVCADTVGNMRVFERYGPSAAQQREITSELVTTTVSSTSSAFEVKFSIADGSDFVFKPSDYLYLIQYRTCATTDGLPEAGTVFGNTAGIDGAVDGSEATVPGRTDQKRGNINTTPVTIDGVEYLPQTTIGWRITVPGEKLADITSDLTVTDVLSGAHQVCVGEGGDIASRLGLKVQAVDQIQNGGLATVDLSASATATLDTDTVTITIPQPTLEQPGGGELSGFSHEYQYVITYTTCTTSGGMDAPGTGYGNAAEVAGSTYNQTVTQTNRGSGTGTGVARGSVTVVKNLADTPGAEFVPDDAVFTVHVKEIDPDGIVQIEYDLQVPVNGSPKSGLNSRGTGWTIELSEPTFPTVPGVAFGSPIFAGGTGVTPSADGTTATADLEPATNIAVSLTNTAELGSLEVRKVLEGPAADLVDPAKVYSITAQIDVSALGGGVPAQPDRVFTVQAGQSQILTDLPIGAVVSFSEALPADDDTLTWAPAVIDPQSIKVVAAHVSDPALITVTNRVDRTVGTFTLEKIVTGAQANNAAVPENVTVTATWNQDGTPGEKILTIPTDGTPVAFGESLLIGTQVTLTETPLTDGSSIAWGAPVWSGTGVTIDENTGVVTISRDNNAKVTLENYASTSTAGISLLKGIAGAAVNEVDPVTEFPVTASWTDSAGVERSKQLTINSVEPTELGVDLPAGTLVTVTEGDRPEFDTVIWGSIVITGEGVEDLGNGSATITVSDQQGEATLVTVANEANWAPGSFSLSKSVTGVMLSNPDVPESITVNASWVDVEGLTQSREIEVPTDGSDVSFGEDLPHNTEVILSEIIPNGSESFTWDVPAWSGRSVETREDGTAVVTIGAATNAKVTLTNNASATLGSLTLVKTLTGNGASRVSAGTAFPVTVSWVDLLGETQQRKITVSTDASTVIDGLPLGTEVRIEEESTPLPQGIRWTAVHWNSNNVNIAIAAGADSHTAIVTVVGETGTSATLTIENEVQTIPDLAITGTGGALLAGAAAMSLALLGGGVLLISRRRMTA